MIVGDLSFLDHDVMGQDTTNGFMETARDRLIRHFERSPGFVASGADFIQRLLAEIKRGGGGVGLEVSTGAIATLSLTMLFRSN